MATIELTLRTDYIMLKEDIDVIAKHVKPVPMLGMDVYDVHRIVSAIEDKEKAEDFREGLIHSMNNLFDKGVDFIEPVEPPEDEEYED